MGLKENKMKTNYYIDEKTNLNNVKLLINSILIGFVVNNIIIIFIVLLNGEVQIGIVNFLELILDFFIIPICKVIYFFILGFGITELKNGFKKDGE